ncbi:MAG: hypothetical protein Q9221_008975 [Calogaya cf. arnoldii]
MILIDAGQSTRRALTAEYFSIQPGNPAALRTRTLPVRSKEGSLQPASTSPHHLTEPPVKKPAPFHTDDSDDSVKPLARRQQKVAGTDEDRPLVHSPTPSSKPSEIEVDFEMNDTSTSEDKAIKAPTISDFEGFGDETITDAPSKKRRRSAGDEARSLPLPANKRQDVEGDVDWEEEGIGRIKDNEVPLLDDAEADDEEREELDGTEEDAEARIQRLLNSKTCEHAAEWEDCCKAFKITHSGISDRDMTRPLPGMKMRLKDWQLVCVYFVLKGCEGENGVYGHMIGDIPGLGKVRPNEGCTFIQVLPGNINQWKDEIHDVVDLEQLEVNLCVAYNGYPPDTSLAEFQPALRTEVSATEQERKQTKSKPISEEAAWGHPTKRSSTVWVLTAWSLWNQRDEIFFKVHQRKCVQDKKPQVANQKLYIFHCGLAIVDEV